MNRLHKSGSYLIAVLFLALVAATLFSGCSERDPNAPTDTYRKGRVRILADVTLQPITQELVAAFADAYPDATLDVAYLTEAEAFRALTTEADTARLLVAARTLNKDELAFFKAKKYTPPQTPIAVDGISLVVHPDNPLAELTIEQLRKVLAGETRTWEALVKGKQAQDSIRRDSIRMVFDDGGSSTRLFLGDTFLGPDTRMLDQAYAAGGHEEVFAYVAEHPNALGFVGYNWVSDTQDSAVMRRREQVRQVALQSSQKPTRFIRLDENENNSLYYLTQGEYPLRRVVYLIKREGRRGLGTGFESYCASGDGQTVIFQAGLQPAQARTRTVELTNELPK